MNNSSMDIDPTHTSNWLFDYGLMDDISAVTFGAPAPATIHFSWPSPTPNCSHNTRMLLDSQGPPKEGSRKRYKL